jgi:hypothetical protein
MVSVFRPVRALSSSLREARIGSLRTRLTPIVMLHIPADGGVFYFNGQSVSPPKPHPMQKKPLGPRMNDAVGECNP